MSWTGSEKQRRQEPPKATKPSPYASDLGKILQTTEAQFTVRSGENVEIRCSGEPWRKHKTKRPLTIYGHTIEGDCIVFRAYGWDVRVKRIAVALPRPPKKSRWQL